MRPARRLGFAALLLALLVLAAWIPALENGFIDLDDPGYVTANHVVGRGLTTDGVRWAFTTRAEANWHPLTWLSHMLDVTLFGLDSRGHHLTSVLFHVANAALLALLLGGLTGWRWTALAAAALFAVHPLRAESVAWVAERKDVLSGFFFLLTLMAWTRYVRGEIRGSHRWGGAVGGPPWSEPPVSATGVNRDRTPHRTNHGSIPRDTIPNSGSLEMGIVSPRTVSNAQAMDSSKSQGHDPEFLETGNRVMSRIFTLIRGHSQGHGIPHRVMSRIFTLNRWYGVSLVLFALGLMSKPMLVTLPFVLLLLDWWPLGRLGNGAPGRIDWRKGGRLVVEKTPFLLLAAGSALVTWRVQQAGAMVRETDAYPLAARLGNAAVSAAAYLGKTVWPVDLAIPYSFPAHGQPWPAVTAALGVLAAITFLAWIKRRRAPFLLVGWGWYLVTLLPVSGVVQLADQAMADRYTYLPLIGPVAAAVAILALSSRRRPVLRPAFTVVLAALILFSAVAARKQTRLWNNDLLLFGHAVESDAGNWLARLNLGVALEHRGRTAEARAQYEAALALAPSSGEAYVNLGRLLADEGDTGGAVLQFEAALRADPGNVVARFNLANMLARLKFYPNAAREYEEVLRRDPLNAAASLNLGNVLYGLGDRAGATERYRRALRLDPGLELARSNLEALGEKP